MEELSRNRKNNKHRLSKMIEECKKEEMGHNQS